MHKYYLYITCIYISGIPLISKNHYRLIINYYLLRVYGSNSRESLTNWTAINETIRIGNMLIAGNKVAINLFISQKRNLYYAFDAAQTVNDETKLDSGLNSATFHSNNRIFIRFYNVHIHQ